MKKAFLFLFLLFNFQYSFGSNTVQKVMARFNIFLSSITEKDIDAGIAEIRNNCDSFNFNRELERCIDLADDQISYYNAIKKKEISTYSISGLAYGVAALGAYTSYYLVSHLDDEINLYKKQLEALGIRVIESDSSEAWAVNYSKLDRIEAERKLHTLIGHHASKSREIIVIACSISLSLCACLYGNDLFLNQYNCDLYHKKYCLIKKRLEWHLHHTDLSAQERE